MDRLWHSGIGPLVFVGGRSGCKDDDMVIPTQDHVQMLGQGEGLGVRVGRFCTLDHSPLARKEAGVVTETRRETPGQVVGDRRAFVPLVGGGGGI